MNEIEAIEKEVELLRQEKKVEKVLAVYLNAIEKYKTLDIVIADEITFRMSYFLFEQNLYEECIEIWRILQKKDEYYTIIKQMVEEAFISPNLEEFQKIYKKNLKDYQSQLYAEKLCTFKKLPYRFIPVSVGTYYLYDTSNGMIGEKIILDLDTPEKKLDDIFKSENIFDTILFGEGWNYLDPIKEKLNNRTRTIFFCSGSNIFFTYLQLPEFSEVYGKNWYFFDKLYKLEDFFHNNEDLQLPRLYNGLPEFISICQKSLEHEHLKRCSAKKRNKSNILLTIGIPSYNRGHRALENIKYLQNLMYDSEIEFLVCDNCSTLNVEGYQEIAKLAESDNRITYYRFPDNPGKNPSGAEAIKRASGKFCCLLSDEDMLYLPNIWKYLYLIQSYGNSIGFINGAGIIYYGKNNQNKLYNKGIPAFERIFWSLNYISGLIYKTSLYRELNLYEWQKNKFEENYFVRAYSHNVIAMRLSLTESIYVCSELLFQEGKSDISMSYDNFGGKQILKYATLESRIEQLDGIIKLLNEWESMLSPETVKKLYLTTIYKIFYLIELHKQVQGEIECDFQEAYGCILRAGIEKIKGLNVTFNNEEYVHMTGVFLGWYLNSSKNLLEEGKIV